MFRLIALVLMALPLKADTPGYTIPLIAPQKQEVKTDQVPTYVVEPGRFVPILLTEPALTVRFVTKETVLKFERKPNERYNGIKFDELPNSTKHDYSFPQDTVYVEPTSTVEVEIWKNGVLPNGPFIKSTFILSVQGTTPTPKPPVVIEEGPKYCLVVEDRANPPPNWASLWTNPQLNEIITKGNHFVRRIDVNAAELPDDLKVFVTEAKGKPMPQYFLFNKATKKQISEGVLPLNPTDLIKLLEGKK